jgi:hypothetical protein
MGLTRVSTAGKRIIIEEDGQTFDLSATFSANVKDTADLRNEFNKQLGRDARTPIFFKKYPDGRIAIATGEQPEDWD